MDAKITVVVPVYNVADYLPKCIESIRNQTYGNLEILLVNDGSTDHSGDICEKYAALDSRITVIHKANGGLSDARNTGIDAASGDYIAFVDSDDWIDEDMYEVLYGLITEHGADLAACRLKEISKSGILDESTDHLMVGSGAEALVFLVTKENNNMFGHNAFNKLIKQELIQHLRFPVGKLVEDLYFMPTLIYASERCVYKDVAKYNYLTDRQGSIMNTRVTEKMVFDELNAYQELEHFFERKGIHGYSADIRAIFIGRLLNFHYQVKYSTLENKANLLATLEDLFHQNLDDSLTPSMNSKRKFQINLFGLSPDIYDRVHGFALRSIILRKRIKPKKNLLVPEKL